jgi:hypothetical protein
MPETARSAPFWAARRAGDEIDYVELPAMGHIEHLDPASNAHEALCGWLGTALAVQTADG